MRFVQLSLLGLVICVGTAFAQEDGRYTRPSDRDLDAITVDLYYEQMAQARHSLNDPAAFRESILNDLRIYALCFAYNRWFDQHYPNNLNYRNNAMSIKAHFGFVAEAMERHGVESAEAAAASFADSQPRLLAQVADVFAGDSDEVAAKAKKSELIDLCYNTMGVPLRMDNQALILQREKHMTDE